MTDDWFDTFLEQAFEYDPTKPKTVIVASKEGEERLLKAVQKLAIEKGWSGKPIEGQGTVKIIRAYEEKE